MSFRTCLSLVPLLISMKGKLQNLNMTTAIAVDTSYFSVHNLRERSCLPTQWQPLLVFQKSSPLLWACFTALPARIRSYMIRWIGLTIRFSTWASYILWNLCWTASMPLNVSLCFGILKFTRNTRMLQFLPILKPACCIVELHSNIHTCAHVHFLENGKRRCRLTFFGNRVFRNAMPSASSLSILPNIASPDVPWGISFRKLVTSQSSCLQWPPFLILASNQTMNCS